jgi:AhpD family alkylhydroperoxidase
MARRASFEYSPRIPEARMTHVHEFNDYRRRMNDRILSTDNLVIKRFFNLDTNTYQEGAVPVKTKEMMGLAASMVLRCDDCVRYHLQECHRHGVTREEIFEVFSVGLVVGGSIVIPHLRRAVEFLDELEAGAK